MSGRVTLRVEGLMLERLVDLALAEGARFAEIRREGRRRMLLTSDAAGAKRTQALAERYGLTARIVAKKGLPALLPRLKARRTLPAALVTCAACLALLLGRVWIVDVQPAGDRPLPGGGADLREALADLGVAPGAPRAHLDPEALALALAARTEGYAFLGARLEGMRLLVEAAPEAEAPELYEYASARDLVAASEGIVVSVNARAGKAAVAPGDAVRRGQVLIRGEERVSAEGTRGVGALGEVVARAWYEGTADAPLLETRRTATGRASASSALRLMDWRFPLTEGEALSPAESRTELLPVGGLFLPLAVERTTLAEYREETAPADEERLRRELSEAAFRAAEAQMRQNAAPGCRIVDKWIEYSMIESERLRARAVLEVQQDIAVTRDALYSGGQ